MNDRELLLEINKISRTSRTITESVERIQVLLGREVGLAALFVRPLQNGTSYFNDPQIQEFLESRDYPFRAVYASRIAVNGEDIAVLVGRFGSWGNPGDFLRRAIEHASGQLAPWFRREGSGIETHQEAA